MKNTKRGEILTLMAIGVMVIIGVVTVISTVFLKAPKNKIATSSHACVPKDYACRHPQPAPDNNPPAVPAGSTDTQQSADQQRAEQQQQRREAQQNSTTPAPAASTQPASSANSNNNGGNCDPCTHACYDANACNAEKAGNNNNNPVTPAPASTPSTVDFAIPTVGQKPNAPSQDANKPGDFDKWHCPGPQCDKCGKDGFWGDGCGQFVQTKGAKDAPYAPQYMWNQQKDALTQQLEKNSIYTDQATCITKNQDAIGHSLGNCELFTDKNGNTYATYVSNDAKQKQWDDALKAKGYYRDENECLKSKLVTDLSGTCAEVPDGKGGKVYTYQALLSQDDCNGEVRVDGGTCAPYIGKDGKTYYAHITGTQQIQMMETQHIYVNEDRCKALNPNATCIQNPSTALWQTQADYQYNLSFNQQVPLLTKDVCDNEVAHDGGLCDPAGTGADGLPYFRHITGQQQIQELAQKGIFVNQNDCEDKLKQDSVQRQTTKCVQDSDTLLWVSMSQANYDALQKKQQDQVLANDCVCVNGHYTGGACSQGSNLYSCLNNTRYPDLAQQVYDQNKAKSSVTCQKQCEETGAGQCIVQSNGNSKCQQYSAEDLKKIASANTPLLSIFGMNFGPQTKCGGELELACTNDTFTLVGGNTLGGVHNITLICSQGLKPGLGGVCFRDAEYANAQAVIQYIEQTPNLTPSDISALIKNNPKSAQYLPDLTKNACGACSGQCVYSGDDKKFSCVSTYDLQKNYRQNYPAGKIDQVGEWGGKCNTVLGGINTGCSRGDLDCNGNGICQLKTDASQLIAIDMKNTDIAGQKINLNLLGTEQLTALALNPDAVKNTVCKSGGPDWAGGACWQCTDSKNQYVSKTADEVCQFKDVAQVTIPGTSCRSSGGFCNANAASGGTSDCPGGFECKHETPSQNFTGGTIAGLGGGCDNDRGPLGFLSGVTGGNRCEDGLRCWNNSCQDVTQLAYNPEYQKGYLASGLNQVPVVGGMLGAVSTAFNGDYTNAAYIRAKNLQKQLTDIQTKAPNLISDQQIDLKMYQNLDPVAKGQIVAMQAVREGHNDNLVAGVITEVGANLGGIAAAYNQEAGTNPFVEFGESGGSIQSAAKMGMQVGFMAADIGTLGTAGLLTKAGTTLERQAIKVSAKEVATDIADQGLRKGFIAIMQRDGVGAAVGAVKDMAISKAAPVLDAAGKVLKAPEILGKDTTGALAQRITDFQLPRIIPGIAGIEESLIPKGGIAAQIGDAIIHPWQGLEKLVAAPIMLPMKTIGLTVAGAKTLAPVLDTVIKTAEKIGLPGVAKLSGRMDEYIAKNVTNDAVAAAIKAGKNLDKNAIQVLSDTAFKEAQQQGYSQGKRAFTAIFNPIARAPSTSLIEADAKGVTDGLMQIVMKDGGTLTGKKRDDYILQLAQDRLRNANIPVNKSIGQIKAAYDAIDLAARWGLHSDQDVRAIAAFIKNDAAVGKPLLKDQAIQLLADRLGGAADYQAKSKANLIVNGLNYEGSPLVTNISQMFQGEGFLGLSKPSALTKIEGVTDQVKLQAAIFNGDLTTAKSMAKLNNAELADLQLGIVSVNTADPGIKNITNLANYQNLVKSMRGKEFGSEDEMARNILLDWQKQDAKVFGSPTLVAQAKAFTNQMIDDGIVTVAGRKPLIQNVELSKLSQFFNKKADLNLPDVRIKIDAKGDMTLVDEGAVKPIAGTKIKPGNGYISVAQDAADANAKVVYPNGRKIQPGNIVDFGGEKWQVVQNPGDESVNLVKGTIDRNGNMVLSNKTVQIFPPNKIPIDPGSGAFKGAERGRIGINDVYIKKGPSGQYFIEDDGWQKLNRKVPKVSDIAPDSGYIVKESPTGRKSVVTDNPVQVNAGDKFNFGGRDFTAVSKPNGEIVLQEAAGGKGAEIQVRPPDLFSLADSKASFTKRSSLGLEDVFVKIDQASGDITLMDKGAVQPVAGTQIKPGSGYITKQDVSKGTWEVVYGDGTSIKSGDVLDFGGQQVRVVQTPGKAIYFIDVAGNKDPLLVKGSDGVLGKISDGLADIFGGGKLTASADERLQLIKAVDPNAISAARTISNADIKALSAKFKNISDPDQLANSILKDWEKTDGKMLVYNPEEISAAKQAAASVLQASPAGISAAPTSVGDRVKDFFAGIGDRFKRTPPNPVAASVTASGGPSTAQKIRNWLQDPFGSRATTSKSSSIQQARQNITRLFPVNSGGNALRQKESAVINSIISSGSGMGATSREIEAELRAAGYNSRYINQGVQNVKDQLLFQYQGYAQTEIGRLTPRPLSDFGNPGSWDTSRGQLQRPYWPENRRVDLIKELTPSNVNRVIEPGRIVGGQYENKVYNYAITDDGHIFVAPQRDATVVKEGGVKHLQVAAQALDKYPSAQGIVRSGEMWIDSKGRLSMNLSSGTFSDYGTGKWGRRWEQTPANMAQLQIIIEGLLGKLPKVR